MLYLIATLLGVTAAAPPSATAPHLCIDTFNAEGVSDEDRLTLLTRLLDELATFQVEVGNRDVLFAAAMQGARAELDCARQPALSVELLRMGDKVRVAITPRPMGLRPYSEQLAILAEADRFPHAMDLAPLVARAMQLLDLAPASAASAPAAPAPNVGTTSVPPSAATPTKPVPWLPLVGALALGAGGASLGAGLMGYGLTFVLGSLVQGRVDDQRARGDAAVVKGQLDLYDQLKPWGTVGAALAVVGTLLVGAGTAALVVDGLQEAP